MGYKFEQVEMPGMPYTLFTREAKRLDGKPRQAAGMMKMPPMIPHPFWLSYVSVANCDESTERAKRLGATITMPPTNIPNIGRFTTLLDPTMAPIAMLGPLPSSAWRFHAPVTGDERPGLLGLVAPGQARLARSRAPAVGWYIACVGRGR